MALPFYGNWACSVVREQFEAGASAPEIAALLATQPRFIRAIEEGLASHQEGVPGGDGSEHAVGMLSAALVEFDTPDPGYVVGS